MSSQDFKKVLVKDDRIAQITDQIAYAVKKGGQSITATEFLASSQSSSSHVFSVQVPSMETLIDRRVMWSSTVVAQIQYVIPSGYTFVMDGDISFVGYGGLPGKSTTSNSTSEAALCPFPLHSMCSTMSATINNTTVNQNMQEVLPVLLRMLDKNDLQRYNSTTPTQFDVCGDYKDAFGSMYDSLAGYEDHTAEFMPRGAWKLDSITSNATAGITTAATTVIVTIQFSVSEPLLMSPFLFGNPHCNKGALYGVQNMNFVFNIGSLNRLWRTTLPQAQATSLDVACSGVINVAFSNSRLGFMFITPHPSDLLSSRNVIPYYELPRWSTLLGAIDLPTSKPSFNVTSQVLPLNQIPDKLILYVKKTISSQNVTDADCFFPITSLTLQFNNNAGLLSTFKVHDLFRASVDAGYNGDFYEFSGSTNAGIITTQAPISTSYLAKARLSGSVVVLDFANTIQISEEFYAPGSIGNFNVQVQATCENNTISLNATNGLGYAPNTVEFVVMAMNSGCIVTERGTSQVYTALLGKQDVLDASRDPAISNSEVKRMVGGSFWDSLKSFAAPLARVAKVALAAVPTPETQVASQVLGALGAGRSGGGVSGGRRDLRLA